IMNQYTPVKNHKFKELNRKVHESEYEDLLFFARSIGIEKAFIQEGEAADESFIPDFSKNSII
ncbi:MAG: radical SAM protein, partial [Clostridia bacterium]|nr:radical SAM protein [Clostridia bacterium]